MGSIPMNQSNPQRNHIFGQEVFQKLIELCKWSFTLPMSQSVKKLQLSKIWELILVLFAVLMADSMLIFFASIAVGIAFVVGYLYIAALWLPNLYRMGLAYVRKMFLS
jgi:uncharacterized membrane protein